MMIGIVSKGENEPHMKEEVLREPSNEKARDL